MQNKYVVSGKGFVKSHPFNTETRQIDIFYTDSIREALPFTGKGARAFITKHKLEAFVWSPWAEDAITDMWEVRYDRDYDFSLEARPSKWKAVRASMRSESDVKFLSCNKQLVTTTLYTEDEAKEVAIKKNAEMVKYLLE